jgi:hypothetical protein
MVRKTKKLGFSTNSTIEFSFDRKLNGQMGCGMVEPRCMVPGTYSLLHIQAWRMGCLRIHVAVKRREYK